MTAGRKDNLITIQRFTETPDGGGGITRTWADLARDPLVWASVKAKAGREALTEGRMNASYVVLFTIWNRADLTELDRIMWDGAPYNIRSVRREGERNLELVIEAERGVAD